MENPLNAFSLHLRALFELLGFTEESVSSREKLRLLAFDLEVPASAGDGRFDERLYQTIASTFQNDAPPTALGSILGVVTAPKPGAPKPQPVPPLWPDEAGQSSSQISAFVLQLLLVQLAGIAEALVIEFKFKDSLRAELTAASDLTLKKVSNFLDSVSRSPKETLKMRVKVDKTKLLSRAERENGFLLELFLLPASAERFFSQPLTKIERLLAGWKAKTQLVILVGGYDVALVGSYFALIGGQHLDAWRELAGKGGVPSDTVSDPNSATEKESRKVVPSEMAQDAVDRVNWVDLHFGYLTPMHLLAEPVEGYDCEQCVLGRTVHARLLDLCLIFSANQTRRHRDAKGKDDWLATYGSGDSLARVRFGGDSCAPAGVLPDTNACSGVVEIAELVIWAYGGPRDTNDRLLCLQNVIAKTLRGRPEETNYQTLVNMAGEVGRQKTWLWESYWAGNLEKHFSRVAHLMDTVAETRKRYDEHVQSLTKSLADNTLAAVAVVVGSFVAAIFKDKFNATVFRIGVGLYAAYVLVFPCVLGLLNVWSRFQAERKAFADEKEIFEGFLDEKPVADVVGSVDAAELRFGRWFWATILIYVVLVASLTTGAVLVPGIVSTDGSDRAVEPPEECAGAWSETVAAELIEGLEAATAPGPPVWVRYALEDGSYGVYAGESSKGRSCLGVWQGGKLKSFGTVAARPKLLTPLYGYHLPWKGNGGPFDPLAEKARQPPELRAWLAEIGVESAVIVPVHVDGLPFELSRLQQVQTALHEAFHVEVQAPRWLGPDGDWPTWDLQPDRAALVSTCYSGNAPVESALGEERDALVRLIQALLDHHTVSACQAGREFLERREARYQLLQGARIAGHDGVRVDCETAEAIMELEEGAADFASWSKLFHLGQASRADLVRRYRAQQKAVFYLTGAMQLHAVELMDPAGFLSTTKEIAASRTLQEGALTNVFTRQLESFCR